MKGGSASRLVSTWDLTTIFWVGHIYTAYIIMQDFYGSHGLCSTLQNKRRWYKTIQGKRVRVIQRVTGGKSGLLPQAWRKRQQSFHSNRRSSEQLSVARSYKPGQLFHRSSWKVFSPQKGQVVHWKNLVKVCMPSQALVDARLSAFMQVWANNITNSWLAKSMRKRYMLEFASCPSRDFFLKT